MGAGSTPARIVAASGRERLQDQVGSDDRVRYPGGPDRCLYGGVITQEPDRRVGRGVQLGQLHQVSDPSRTRGGDEPELLDLGPLAGVGDQESPFDAMQNGGERRWVVKVSLDHINPGTADEACGIGGRTHHRRQPDSSLDQRVHDTAADHSRSTCDQDSVALAHHRLHRVSAKMRTPMDAGRAPASTAGAWVMASSRRLPVFPVLMDSSSHDVARSVAQIESDRGTSRPIDRSNQAAITSRHLAVTARSRQAGKWCLDGADVLREGADGDLESP